MVQEDVPHLELSSSYMGRWVGIKILCSIHLRSA